MFLVSSTDHIWSMHASACFWFAKSVYIQSINIRKPSACLIPHVAVKAGLGHHTHYVRDFHWIRSAWPQQSWLIPRLCTCYITSILGACMHRQQGSGPASSCPRFQRSTSKTKMTSIHVAASSIRTLFAGELHTCDSSLKSGVGSSVWSDIRLL